MENQNRNEIITLHNQIRKVEKKQNTITSALGAASVVTTAALPVFAFGGGVIQMIAGIAIPIILSKQFVLKRNDGANIRIDRQMLRHNLNLLDFHNQYKPAKQKNYMKEKIAESSTMEKVYTTGIIASAVGMGITALSALNNRLYGHNFKATVTAAAFGAAFVGYNLCKSNAQEAHTQQVILEKSYVEESPNGLATNATLDYELKSIKSK